MYKEDMLDLKDRTVPIKMSEIVDFVKGEMETLDLAPPPEIQQLRNEQLPSLKMNDSATERLEQRKIAIAFGCFYIFHCFLF
jgi:hypothetical protein